MTTHSSDCSTHNEPAERNGPCDCGAESWIPPAVATLAFGIVMTVALVWFELAMP